MSLLGVNGSKYAPSGYVFLDGLPAWQLMGFRNYIHSPAFIVSNPSQFLDHEWILIYLMLKIFWLGTRRVLTLSRSRRAREVMDFQNYAPSFIESDAADLNWIEVPALRKFLEQKISIETPHASGPNTRTISVKSEPQLISLSRVCGAVKLRTLNQGGREILKLISESEAEDSDPDCDVEVTAALMRTSSRSSSTIPQSDAMDTDDRGPDEGGIYTSYLG
ncbi:hypothetical protein B0H13DRAFT_2667388, partial [Mycena leptocephala]